jgi:deoxyribodipyrimidine photo-lyase
MEASVAIFWFRRDLRLKDNNGLFQALLQNDHVLPLFIFDTDILDDLEETDPRVSYIYDLVTGLKKLLEDLGSTMIVKYGKPLDVFRELARTYSLTAVYKNHDYEPYSTERDQELALWFKNHGIGFHTFKDQVIFEKNEVVKADGTPYVVYSPYMRAWKEKVNVPDLPVRDLGSVKSSLLTTKPQSMPSLNDMGFRRSDYDVPGPKLDEITLKNYHEARDFPAREGTSRLSVHLRFGTVSIREVVQQTATQNETFLNELIWREFYMMILWHFPHVVDRAFKPAYDNIIWVNDEAQFEAWCNGKTGYPIVDAGMRQLNQTGYMHNRVRMVTASFLVKDLLIDWRWGESYFAKKLMDFELSSNNGGWQWAAGSGCDAAPYFRIFNPESQTKKFDPDKKYIKSWVPELGTDAYPKPIVNHKEARKSTLLAYKKALN